MTDVVSANGSPLRAGENGLRSLEVLDRYEGGVGVVLRPNPGARFIPAHLGVVAQCDVIHVDEHLVAALTVPYLTAGVARVQKDCPNG